MNDGKRGGRGDCNGRLYNGSLRSGQTVLISGKAYEIAGLIARGKGGYTYLAQAEDAEVVVKQIHYEPCDYYQFEDNKLDSELRDYQTLSGLSVPMPQVLSLDQEKQMLVKEYIAGDTLAVLAANGGIDASHIRQILDICGKLYPNRLNIDYFPTNFIVRQGALYYVDYECSPYSDEWNFENWGVYFLANQEGMRRFVDSGDYSLLIKGGKPIRDGFEDIVNGWLGAFYNQVK
jgi:tRNA A-37 threonylcarbamoyl transferase component Bud32